MDLSSAVVEEERKKNYVLNVNNIKWMHNEASWNDVHIITTNVCIIQLCSIIYRVAWPGNSTISAHSYIPRDGRFNIHNKYYIKNKVKVKNWIRKNTYAWNSFGLTFM